MPALARGFRICATLQLLAPPSKQAPARGRLWPQARGAGLRGNLMSVSGVLPRLLDRSVLAAKVGILWRSSWLKSRQLLLPPVSLPAVLPPYGFNKCPWALWKIRARCCGFLGCKWQ